jgi:hypothetical protein
MAMLSLSVSFNHLEFSAAKSPKGTCARPVDDSFFSAAEK